MQCPVCVWLHLSTGRPGAAARARPQRAQRPGSHAAGPGSHQSGAPAACAATADVSGPEGRADGAAGHAPGAGDGAAAAEGWACAAAAAGASVWGWWRAKEKVGCCGASSVICLLQCVAAQPTTIYHFLQTGRRTRLPLKRPMEVG